METQDLDLEQDAARDAAEGVEEKIPETGEDFGMAEEMIKAGLIYGHKKSKTNPKFKPYIYTTRNGVEIIDVTQTLPALNSAVEFLSGILKNKGSVLIVATQPAAKEAATSLAKKFNFSIINDRWIGGLLTNFKVISKRIDYFKKIRKTWRKASLKNTPRKNG